LDVNGDDFSDSVLIVLGHGTTLNDQSAEPVLQHADELRRRGIFREVRESFWKQDPQVQKVLAEVSARRIFIAPMFISDGYFASQVIPGELGFPSVPSVIRRAQSILFYCEPVGSHDSMTKVILSRAGGVVKQYPFPRAPKSLETTLYIAGHGTERNKKSREAVERQVAILRTQNVFAAVYPAFIEEPPFIKGCVTTAATKYCVVVPFFISDGLHAVEDIPVLLGEPENIVKQRLAAGQPTWRNPTEKDGKLVWYSPAVGTEPLMADVILERVREGVVRARQSLAPPLTD
jgi:sirohydrochlorin cobaltochelatase